MNGEFCETPVFQATLAAVPVALFDPAVLDEPAPWMTGPVLPDLPRRPELATRDPFSPEIWPPAA